MSLLNSASLVVTPNGYKEGTLYSVIPNTTLGDMTVVRATTATRVNSAGLIELVPYNLITYSEDYTQSNWAKLSAGTGTAPIITSNYAISPDGTLNASRIVLDKGSGTTSSDYSAINDVITLLGDGSFSIYLKSNTGTNYIVSQRLENVRQQITITSEWQRFVFSASSLVNGTSGLWLRGGYGSDDYADILVWGAQLVKGTLPKDYQKTETRLNIPRLDYSNGSCPSLLVEPQRTNLVTYSEQLDNAAWTKSGVTVTANTTISPDGTQNADTVTNITTSDFISQIIGAPTATAYAASFYIKNEDSTTTIILVRNAANSLGGNINWNGSELVSITGVVNGTLTFESVGNDWYRIFGNFTSVETVQRVRISPDSTASGKSVYVWGYQLEQGASYATSYIPTTTASVTRNADVISKTGISSLIGQTEGTLYFEVQGFSDGNPANQFITLNDGTSNNQIGFHFTLTLGRITGYFRVNSVTYQITSTVLKTLNSKIILKYNSSNVYTLFINGSLIGTGTAASSFSSPLTAFKISQGNGSSPYNGKIKSIVLYQTALTNDQCIDLTT